MSTRKEALAEAVTAYEKRFGAISARELANQARADRESAIVVRGSGGRSSKRKTRARGTT
jgi:uncharacterized protein YllA (UPF0747 family)